MLTAANAKLLKAKKVKGKIVETDIPKDAQVLVIIKNIITLYFNWTL